MSSAVFRFLETTYDLIHQKEAFVVGLSGVKDVMLTRSKRPMLIHFSERKASIDLLTFTSWEEANEFIKSKGDKVKRSKFLQAKYPWSVSAKLCIHEIHINFEYRS